MNVAIGISILAILFGTITIMMVRSIGLRATLLTWVIAIFMTALICIAVLLITGNWGALSG